MLFKRSKSSWNTYQSGSRADKVCMSKLDKGRTWCDLTTLIKRRRMSHDGKLRIPLPSQRVAAGARFAKAGLVNIGCQQCLPNVCICVWLIAMRSVHLEGRWLCPFRCLKWPTEWMTFVLVQRTLSVISVRRPTDVSNLSRLSIISDRPFWWTFHPSLFLFFTVLQKRWQYTATGTSDILMT